nr:MAG TPA: hypothetical protein [Caudoviricetes sp.]
MSKKSEKMFFRTSENPFKYSLIVNYRILW